MKAVARPEPRRRPWVGRLSLGCLVVLLLAVGGTVLWVVAQGHYQPRIDPPLPAPSPNGFDDYLVAGQMLKAHGGTKAMYAPGSTSRVDLSRAAPVVARNQDALTRMRRAFGKSCRVPVARSIDSTYAYAARTRDLARLVMADGRLRAKRGDYAGAIGDGLDDVQMGQDIARGGGLIPGLVSIAVQTLGQWPMVASVDRVPAPQCEQLLERYQRLLKDRWPTAATLTEERNAELTVLTSTLPRKLLASGQEDDDSSGGRRPEEVPNEAAGVMWHFMRDSTLREVEDRFGQALRQAALPAASRTPIAEPRTIVGRIMLPEFGYAMQRFDTCDARNRLLLCALAIRCYRLKHGRLPGSLADLGLDPTLTTDPFTGKPLIYRPVGGDYLLYSVGPNLEDDGAIPLNESRGLDRRAPGDLGLRPYRYNPTGRQQSDWYRRVPHMRLPVLPRGAPPLPKE